MVAGDESATGFGGAGSGLGSVLGLAGRRCGALGLRGVLSRTDLESPHAQGVSACTANLFGMVAGAVNLTRAGDAGASGEVSRCARCGSADAQGPSLGTAAIL